jgi:hypothetical protein
MVPKWARVTLKWEGNIHKWAEGIALPQRDSRKARKNQANAEDRSVTVKSTASNDDRNTQEGCWNGSGSLTLVLAVEQLFQFFL